MVKKLFSRAAACVLMAFAAAFSVGLSGCANGKDGADGKDLNIFDIYEAAKTVPGNENLTLDEFLKEYLSYNSEELAQAVSLQAAVNRSLMSSVCVRAIFRELNGGQFSYVSGLGSGVILDVDRQTGDMIVATNCHIVYSAKSVYEYMGLTLDGYSNDISVWLYGTEYREDKAISAQIMCASKTYDLALLKIENSAEVRSSHAAAASWTTGEEAYLGETVYTVGNSEGNGTSALVGYVSRDSEPITVNLGTEESPENYIYRVIRTSAPISGGNSGGGLYDAGGNLKGIVNAKSRPGETALGYVLPASEAKRVIAQMLAQYGGEETHGVYVVNHGVTVEVTDAYSTGLNSNGLAELYEEVTVAGVNFGKAHGKLTHGDVLKHVTVTRGGETVVDMDILRAHNFNDAMLAVTGGDEVTFTYSREGVSGVATVVYGQEDMVLKQ